jgi:quercetin dioxygenase-like cupin family protein
MTHPLPFGGVLPRALAAVAAVAVSSLVATSAFAGECPADKQKANATKPVTHAAKGVTDTTLAAIDLAKEPANIKNRELRFRKLTIEPGGVVPWHSHEDRPALIFVAEGEIYEYASNCEVPILHKTGEVARETSKVAHWWQNKGTKTVILYVGDVRRDPNDKHM